MVLSSRQYLSFSGIVIKHLVGVINGRPLMPLYFRTMTADGSRPRSQLSKLKAFYCIEKDYLGCDGPENRFYWYLPE